MDKKFFKNTWTDVSGIPFSLKWYRELFNLHHYTMSDKSIDYWEEYRLSQLWPQDKWQKYIDKKFINIFDYAYENNPYYKKLYDSNNVKIKDIKNISDITRLPLVEKSSLSMGIGDLSSKENVTDENTLLIKTSGSTGARMNFTCDMEQLDRRWAAWMRLFEWSGWQWGNKEIRFWFKYASTVKNPKVEAFDAFLSNRHFYDFDQLDDVELLYFCDEINKLDPFVITGYWEAIETIAKYAYKNNIKLKAHAIIPSTQIVPDNAKKMVSKVFQCDVYDKYASAEFSGIGHQCEKHDLYHIQSENIYLEILKNGKPITEGIGEAVVTDFSNKSTPLIRYRIGDVLEATTQTCSCNKTLPVFKRPQGRLKNTIKINDRIITEMQLASLEFELWDEDICDRIKFVQTEENDLTILASKVNDDKKLKNKIEDFTQQKENKIIKVDTIDHFRGKRHRGESKLTNIFNN